MLSHNIPYMFNVHSHRLLWFSFSTIPLNNGWILRGRKWGRKCTKTDRKNAITIFRIKFTQNCDFNKSPVISIFIAFPFSLMTLRRTCSLCFCFCQIRKEERTEEPRNRRKVDFHSNRKWMRLKHGKSNTDTLWTIGHPNVCVCVRARSKLGIAIADDFVFVLTLPPKMAIKTNYTMWLRTDRVEGNRKTKERRREKARERESG